MAHISGERLEDIYAFLRLSDHVGTGGQPTAEQLAAVRSAGYSVVVNLLPPDAPHALPKEAEIVSALGLKYISIPVVWQEPQSADAERFFGVMDEHQGENVFVHCAANMRVSAFMYLYRVLRQGMPPAQAATDLGRIWSPNQRWREFMETLSGQPPHEQ